jgi:hypothetical protein
MTKNVVCTEVLSKDWLSFAALNIRSLVLLGELAMNALKPFRRPQPAP